MTKKIDNKNRPYFSHDIFTREQDKKIDKLFFEFRKESDEKAWAAYGIFWGIVEYLYCSELLIEDIDMLADKFRIDKKFLQSILNDFDLFEKVNDREYVSNRIVRNLELQEEKSKKAANSASQGHEQKKKLIDDIMALYSEVFDKDYIASDEVRKIIQNINSKNKQYFANPLETWKKIIDEAHRGWDYKNDKHVKPTFNYILKNWNAILSGDCNFAADKEAIKKQNEANKNARKQFDADIHNVLLPYDDYNCSTDIIKLEAQKIYTAEMQENSDEKAAEKAAVLYCREAVNDAST